MMKFNKGNFNLAKAALKHKTALGLYANTAAKRLEAEAKRDAPWTDRTSNARNSIQGTAGWDGDVLKVILSGGMHYSVYLELAHEKRFATLKPTIDKNAPNILQGYQKLVKG